MSPIPNPPPLGRSVARFVFSPAGLLFGFVALLIVTCPGARGDSSLGLITDGAAAFSGGGSELDGLRLSVPPQAARALPRPVARPTGGDSSRLQLLKPRALRTAAPGERSGGDDLLTQSLSATPLLVDPLLKDPPKSAAAGIRPMTGPTVGIRPKLPAARY